MIILMDSGNTRVKLGWLDSRGRRESAPLTLDDADPAVLDHWLGGLPARPSLAVGVNVAGRERAQALASHLERYGCPTRWVTSLDHAAGLRNAYDPPAQLGPDRWVSMVGLLSHAQRGAGHPPGNPAMLATFGTATTIDTLAPEAPDAWVFRGGLILPGPEMMRSALARGTALLPDADGSVADYPTHTRQAIATGIAAAQAGALARQWAVGLEYHGQPPRVYSAGGGWPAVEHEARRQLARAQAQAGVAQSPIEWLPTPVLDGLAVMAPALAAPDTAARTG